MSEQNTVQLKTSVEERFIQALFRLPRLVTINLPNSPIVMESFNNVKNSLKQMCAESGQASLRIYHGRFYVNEKRVAFLSTHVTAIAGMVDFFQDREIQGLKFFPKDNLTLDDMILLINLLTQSVKEKDSLGWFKAQLEASNCTWVQVMTDQDFKKAVRGVNEDDEDQSQQSSYSQALGVMGRRAYAQAMKSFRHVVEKLSGHKRVGIQRPKRVIQGQVELLAEDESVLLGLSTIRDYDDYTYTHSINVAMLSMCLGKRIGLPPSVIGQLGLCGLFHDLGKTDLPIDLIQKPAQLTADEFELVKSHSLNSVRQIVKMTADFSLKTKLMLPPFEHHLGLNLAGYPQSERKAPLSLFGRIVAICDHYDAMTSDRAYRTASIRPDQALRMMIDEAGPHLDPVLLKIFIGMVGVYPVGTLLVMDTREVGLALGRPETGGYDRPLVSLLTRDEEGQLTKGDNIDLAERDPVSGAFKRNVIRCLHPSDYGIQAADFLL